MTPAPAAAPTTPLRVAALAVPDPIPAEMASTGAAPAAPRVARDAQPTAAPPEPATVQLAALVEPAPARAEPAQSPAPPTKSVTPSTTPVAVPPPAATPASPYRVQLALLRDEQNVKYVWHDFVDRFGASAKDLHRYVFPTQTAKGVRHLVQVGPFGDQDHAEAMCNKLKERGGDCMVVHQPS